MSYNEISDSLTKIDDLLKKSSNLEKHSEYIVIDKNPPLSTSKNFLEKEFKEFDQNCEEVKKFLYIAQVNADKSETVRKCCRDAGFPSLEEYDYLLDKKSRSLKIRLKLDTEVRPYQKKSLSRMFGNGRARSGIIVLPCGAGKTLVGISAACTVSKSTIVFATTGVSCQQWKSQFLKWVDFSNCGNVPINMFIASTKEPIPKDKPCIIITTYSMIAFSQKRSREAERMMSEIRSREWGLVILDEVHVAPAEMFRKCLNITKSKCKLGLTATLVREDEKIEDLFFLLGPKLYEADWISLQKERYLATVECVEVWCPMASTFYKKYIQQNSLNRKTLLQTMNPTKFRNCEFLIRYHEAKGDKIMVFSDNIYSLKKYAIILQKPFIYGKTSETERLLTLDALQHDPEMNTIFISKIGDCSIDLPDVNVIIQISSHFSSRRQEAQRLGRILRPKSKSNSNAYFYTLVSQDTDECFYAFRRQRFLVDQGYSFNVKKSLVEESDESLMFSSKESHSKLLEEVMDTSELLGAVESDAEDPTGKRKVKGNKKTSRKRPIKIKSNKLKNLKANIIRAKKQLKLNQDLE